MIGKPQWFTRRKYGGWGIAPKTWQAWVYIAVFLGLFVGFQALPFWDNTTRVIATGIFLFVILLDTFDIMIHMKLDEREKMHEAIAERNALWVTITLITGYLLYQAIKSGLEEKPFVDFGLVGIIIAAVLTKAITNIYLDRKN